MKKLILLTLSFLLTLTSMAQPLLQPSVASTPYTWKSVQVVGGGFVDGIVFHPKAKDIRYCRTDMGGAYRWDASLNRWVSMLDWIGYDDNNLVGVESIAVDPNDAQTVYLSCGTYTRSTNGAILCSNDGGRTFRRTDMPFAMGGNENGRGNGERMMVDPADSRLLYLGTRLDGLWRSTDRGNSWQRVTSFPDIKEVAPAPSDESQARNPWANRPQGCGIIFVHFDERTAVPGKGCATLYVGVSLMNRENLFVSHDHGDTWQPVEGQPTAYRPTHAAFASNGELYITYGTNPGPMRMEDGAVWKYNTLNKKWQEISPVKPDAAKGLKFGYASVSVDPQNPQHVIVSSFNLPVPDRYAEDDIYRSTNGGKTWKPIFVGDVRFDHTKAPYTAFTPIHWMFDIEIDPFDPNHAMFTTGYGGWETFNLSDQDKKKPVVWHIMGTGIEETVPLELYSPTKGAQLITAIGDYGGFTHFDPDVPVAGGSHSNPYYANTNGVTGAENKPELVVRVGTVSHHHPGGKALAYSLDGGISWIEPETLPDEKAANGYIAVSPDGETWIWSPARLPVYYTTDKGKTWHLCEGVPENTRIVADKVSSSRFYGFDITTGKLYESADKGRTFESQQILQELPRQMMRGDRRGGQDKLYATPGSEGELWIPAYDGLYRLLPGRPMQKLDKVRSIYGFGFGKEAPGKTYPAIYLIGVVNGLYGFYRSDDAAQSWIRINDDNHQYGLVLHVIGDPKKYGRVYLGTHGRGTLYGDPTH